MSISISGDTRIFAHEYFDKWIKKRKIPLAHGGYFVCGDLRKFTGSTETLLDGTSQIVLTFSRMASQEWTGDTISIRFRNLCMTSI